MSTAARIWKLTLATVKSKDTREYFMSTHFWGPLLNFGIPLAAISDMWKPADMISGKMTVGNTVWQKFHWQIFMYSHRFSVPSEGRYDSNNRIPPLIQCYREVDKQALFFYSAACMRFAWMVTPRNRLLFACHVINDIAQIIQGTRFVHYHHFTSHEDVLL